MSKMQKWVTSVTFALLFTGGVKSALATPQNAGWDADVTNTAYWVVSEDALGTDAATSYAVPTKIGSINIDALSFGVVIGGVKVNAGLTDKGCGTVNKPGVVPDSFSITMSSNKFGPDSFLYQCETGGLGKVVWVRQFITVNPVNDAPVAATNSTWAVVENVGKYVAPAAYPTNWFDLATMGADAPAAFLVQDDADLGVSRAFTNFTYAVDTSALKYGTLVPKTTLPTNSIFAYVPNAHAATTNVQDWLTFTVKDNGQGASAALTSKETGLIKITVVNVAEKPDTKNETVFLEQQVGQTNSAPFQLWVSDFDIGAPAENYQTNFSYQAFYDADGIGGAAPVAMGAPVRSDTVAKFAKYDSGLGWYLNVSATGQVEFVVTETDTNKFFNLSGGKLFVAINQITGYAPVTEGLTTNAFLNLFWMPKNAPLMLQNSDAPLANPTIFDGQSQNFAITYQDFATNSLAGPTATLTKYGMQKIVWEVRDASVFPIPSVFTNVAQTTDAPITVDGIYSTLASTFAFTKDFYALTTGASNFVVAAVAYDILGNKTEKRWTVTVVPSDTQIVTLPKIYEVPVLSNITIQASVNTTNTVFEWTVTDPTTLEAPVPGDNVFSTTNTAPTFRALKGCANNRVVLTVRAAQMGKYAPSAPKNVQIDVLVPINLKTVTVLQNGETVETSDNKVTKSPDKAYYKCGDKVTFAAVAAAGFAFTGYKAPPVFVPVGFVTSGAQGELGAWTVADANYNNENLLVTAGFKAADALMKPVIVDPGAQNWIVSTATDLGLTVLNEGAAAPTMKIQSGALPAGMALINTGGAPLWHLLGTPTSTGSGEVTLVASNASGDSEPVTIAWTVTDLPEWLVGTYVGAVQGGTTPLAGMILARPFPCPSIENGTGTLTIDAKGKATGKYSINGTTVAIKSTAIAAGVVPGSYTITTFYGPINVMPPAPGANGELVPAFISDTFACGTALCLFRTEGKNDASVAAYAGYYTVSLTAGPDYGSGYLTITVKDAVAKVAGKLADDTAVSFSAPMYVWSDGANPPMVVADILAVPAKYKRGTFGGRLQFTTNAAGKKIVVLPAIGGVTVLAWNNNDPKSTAEYAGFARTIEAVQGGLFGTVTSLADYYTSNLTVEGVMAPDLDYNQAVTDYVDGKKTKQTFPETAEAAMWDENGLKVTPNGIEVPPSFVLPSSMKVDTPKKNSTTKLYEYIDNTGDGVLNNSALKISLVKKGTTVTGVFKGTFNTFYDYLSAIDNTTGKETAAHIVKGSRFEGVLVPVRQLADYPEGAGYFLWKRKVIVPPAGGFFDKDYIYYFNESWDFRLVK